MSDRAPGQPSPVKLPEATPRPLRSMAFEASESKWDKQKIHLVKKAGAFLIIIGIFYFLGKNLRQNFAEISHLQWTVRYELLILSFLFVVMSLAMACYAWKEIVSLFRTPPPFAQSFKIMSISALGKYIPGKVWQYMSQIYLGQKVGLPKTVTFFSMVLLFMVYNLVGGLVFLLSLFLWQRFSPFLVLGFLLTFVLISLAIFYPPVLNKVLEILLRLFRRKALAIKAGFDQRAKILLILIADWIAFGIGVCFLVNSFYRADLGQVVILCGIFAISVICGILSFFVPAGLGVREGVQSYLLSLFIPISMAILISLVMRVWITLAELACFLIALKIKKPNLT